MKKLLAGISKHFCRLHLNCFSWHKSFPFLFLLVVSFSGWWNALSYKNKETWLPNYFFMLLDSLCVTLDLFVPVVGQINLQNSMKRNVLSLSYNMQQERHNCTWSRSTKRSTRQRFLVFLSWNQNFVLTWISYTIWFLSFGSLFLLYKESFYTLVGIDFELIDCSEF